MSLAESINGWFVRVERKPIRVHALALSFVGTFVILAGLYLALAAVESQVELAPAPPAAVAAGESHALAAAVMVLERGEAMARPAPDGPLLPNARAFETGMIRDGGREAVARLLAAAADRDAGLAAPLAALDRGARPALAALRRASERTEAFSNQAKLASLARTAAAHLGAEATALQLPNETGFPRSIAAGVACAAHARGVAWGWATLWQGAIDDAALRSERQKLDASQALDLLSEAAARDSVFERGRIRIALTRAAARLSAFADTLDGGHAP